MPDAAYDQPTITQHLEVSADLMNALDNIIIDDLSTNITFSPLFFPSISQLF